MDYIFAAFYDFILPLLAIGIVVFSSMYLSDKNECKKQLQKIRRYKSNVSFTVILVVLYPFAIFLFIYYSKQMANVVDSFDFSPSGGIHFLGKNVGEGHL
ncbi:hypothetical protein K2225_03700 [Halobacillus sp. Nhm2S1]|nr:hypothetical protein [Halobacillus sp. Nhm2S1]